MTDLEVFDERRCVVGEGPFWEPQTGRVGWVDILGSAVHYRHPSTGETSEVDAGAHLGAAIVAQDGGLVLCLPDGPAARSDDGNVRQLATYADADRAASVEQPATPIRSNDAKTDPAGRLWVGSMAYDESAVGALYRLSGNEFARIFGDARISNGLGWSPDGRLMYYIDTLTNQVDVFDYDLDTGTPTDRRLFVDLADAEGSPDGMCIDADGGIWVAMWGGGCVRHYNTEGNLAGVVEVPTPQTSSCAFVGDDLDGLIITTAARGRPDSDTDAGRTYVCQPGVAGMPVTPFAG